MTLFRGTSLSDALEDEIGRGVIDGETLNVYRGLVHDGAEHRTLGKGIPISEAPWKMPDPSMDVEPYIEDTVSITGGVSTRIGTAVGFAAGSVPVVLYLNESSMPTGTNVRYGLDYFDTIEGSMPRVAGDAVDGEIRTDEHGLVGLTSTGADGPVVWEWGRRELADTARAYEDEREVIYQASQVDIADATRAVAVMLEGRRTPEQALATFPGYHAGFGSEGINTNTMADREVLETLHDEIRTRAPMALEGLWTISLNSSVLGSFEIIPSDDLAFAFDGSAVYDSADQIPAYLMG